MTLSELIEQLQDLQQETEDDPEVRLAHQPQWPFEYSIGSVQVVNLKGEDYSDEEPDELSDEERAEITAEPDDFVVYIAESGQIGYLPGVASRELGWR